MPRRVTEFGNSIYEDCGKYSGWNRHQRYKTKACKPCTDARNTYMRERRHRIGESSGTWVYVPDVRELTDDDYCI